MKSCVYTVKDVSEMLKISEKTVYRLVHETELFSILVRGQYRIPSYALEEFLKGGSKIEERNKSTAL